MDDKKIAFIVCVNNELYYNECVSYIKRVNVPAGFEVEIIKIENASSMASGYNDGMRRTDAKYKIYMHQDVYIRNKNLLSDIIEIFKDDEKNGILGVVGGIDLPPDATIWDAWNVGGTYGTNFYNVQKINFFQDSRKKYIEVEAADGMFLATQYDILWREEILDGWDFYDVSQSLEFRRAGFKVVIPYQADYWCMHDCGHSKLVNYDMYRNRILEEYKDYFNEIYTPKVNLEFWKLQENIFHQFKNLFDAKDYVNAFRIVQEIGDTFISDNNLRYARNLFDIYRNEHNISTATFFEEINCWEQAKEKFDCIKFVLWDIEKGQENERLNHFIMSIKCGRISTQAIAVIAVHVNEDCKKALSKLKEKLLETL